MVGADAMTWLFTLWGWKNWVLGGVIALAVGGAWLYVKTLQAENLSLEKSLDVAVSAAQANAKAIIDMQVATDKIVVALKVERQKLTNRVKTVEGILKDVESAPPSDDGPVAPVLAHTLERLFDGAQGDNQGPGGAPPGSSAPVELRPHPTPR